MPQPVLKIPFVIEWKQCNNESSAIVFESMKNILGPLRRKSTKKPKISKRKSSTDETKQAEENSTIERKTQIESDKTEINKTPESKNFKPYFVFGMAQVLRELERKTLSVAIFDRNILKAPPIAFQIGTLCVNSGPFCSCLDDLSKNLCSILGIRSTMAVGIKSSNDNLEIENLQEMIKKHLNNVIMKNSDDENVSKKSQYVSPTVVLPDVKRKKARKTKKTKKLKLK